MHAKDNKAVGNSGYENFGCTIKGPMKMLIRHLWYAHYAHPTLT